MMNTPLFMSANGDEYTQPSSDFEYLDATAEEPKVKTKPGSRLPQRFDPEAPLFLISTAARLAGMHPQTLRTYDRLGLVIPKRTSGKGRRYSIKDVEKLRLIQYLTQDEGINLIGVRHILALRAEVERLQAQSHKLTEELQRVKTTLSTRRVFTVSQSDGVWLRTRTREIMPS